MSNATTGKASVTAIASGRDARKRSAGTQLARLPAPAHQLREKAAALLAKTLKALFDGADDALFDLADRATNNQDQNVYFDAMREVRLQRRDIEQCFYGALDRAYASLLDEAPNMDVVSAPDELMLVGNEQLELQVAVDGMVAKALGHCAEAAQHIALRLDSLVPVKVYQQNNPVGPEMLCRAYRDVIEPLDIDIKAKLVLLKLFDKAVMAQLSKIYSLLNNLLIQHNILPSLARQSTPAAPSSVKSSERQQEVAVGTRATGTEHPLLNQLRELLPSASGLAVDAQPLAASAVPVSAEQLLQLLSGAQKNSLQSPAASAEQLLAPLAARQVPGGVERDVINLVNMLFEFILDDRNLSDIMKSLLGRLQIPMIKVAIVDKDFFNRGGHPARRLLNELATAALGWQAPNKEGVRDPLRERIESVVQRVLTEFDTNVELFDELLADFLAFIEKERRRASILERRTLDAEDGKAKAEQGRAEVERALAELTEGVSLPAPVSNILTGPWSNVLFLHGLKTGVDSVEWEAATSVAADLIWSVTAEINPVNRKRLLGLIPNLLERLRAGFESIAFNPFEMNALFRELEPFHLNRLQAVADKVEPTVAISELAQSTVEPEAPSTTAKADTETAAAIEQVVEPAPDSAQGREGGRAPQEPVAAAPLRVEAASDKADRDASGVLDSTLAQVDALVQGCWFEVSDGAESHYRCRLAAIIRSVDKYIFVNRNGMKVSENNRLGLAQALEAGSFRLLDDGMLFDRALEAVIGDLRKVRTR